MFKSLEYFAIFFWQPSTSSDTHNEKLGIRPTVFYGGRMMTTREADHLATNMANKRPNKGRQRQK